MQMKHLASLLTASLLVVAAQAPAQTKIYSVDSDATSGGCNVIPFGSTSASATWSNQKYQTLVDAKTFGTKAGQICSLGLACCRTGIKKFSSIEIKMDYFQGSGSTMSTTFSANISNKAQTVLSATNYVFHTTQNQWTHVGLEHPFLYFPAAGHLIVQVTVTGAEGSGSSFRTGSLSRLYATGTSWSNNQPPATGTLGSSSALKMEIGFDAWAVDTFGVGCAGSNNKTPQLMLTGSAALGQKLKVGLMDALPNAGAFFVIGLGVPSNPLDMGVFGAPGCNINISLDFVLGISADPKGQYTRTFEVPNNEWLVCLPVYVQFFPHDKSVNPFGASASNYGRVLIGR